MRDQFISTLHDLAKADDRTYLITGDLGFGVLTEYAETFPDQFLNVGVAEQNMMGVASGLALEGRKVYTYSIGNFPTLRCLEQLRNGTCYHDLDVTVVCVGGGFSYGQLGMSHHATEDISILRSLPMTMFAPCDLWETEQGVKELAKISGPKYLRLDKGRTESSPTSKTDFSLGKARKLRDGNDFTIIGCGGIMQEALDAADSLSKRGVECRVLSMHTIKPIDKEAITKAAQETGGILTLEEHTLDGGLGGAISEVCMDQRTIPKAFHRIGLKGGFSSIVGTQKYLRKAYEMDATVVEQAICQSLETARP